MPLSPIVGFASYLDRCRDQLADIATNPITPKIDNALRAHYLRLTMHAVMSHDRAIRYYANHPTQRQRTRRHG